VLSPLRLGTVVQWFLVPPKRLGTMVQWFLVPPKRLALHSIRASKKTKYAFKNPFSDKPSFLKNIKSLYPK
jgi:hypothetical protein